MEIAAVASNREIRRVVITTVLPGHDVLDVKRDVNGSLRETAAVLTAMVSPLPHQFSNRCIRLRCPLGELPHQYGLRADEFAWRG